MKEIDGDDDYLREGSRFGQSCLVSENYLNDCEPERSVGPKRTQLDSMLMEMPVTGRAV